MNQFHFLTKIFRVLLVVWLCLVDGCAILDNQAEVLYDQAIVLYDQAMVLYDRGCYGEAEPLLRRALAINEEALGPDHRNTALILNNLALVLYAQGRYGEAESLHRRALAIQEKVLGPEHSYTAISLGGLAWVLQAQGRYGEAEPLYRRALAANEKALGPDYPHTLSSINNLALLYQAQGRYEEAESLLRRVLAARERSLGPDHPDTLASINNLAVLYQAQGRYGEAQPLFDRALTGFKKVLGPNHPDTLTSASKLAFSYQAQYLYSGLFLKNRKILGMKFSHSLPTLYQAQDQRVPQPNPLPEFPLPPPQASATFVIPRSVIIESDNKKLTLNDVDQKFQSVFYECGYVERSYYAIPDGFVIVTRLEQINPDGTPKQPPDRWSVEIPTMRGFNLGEYIKALFTPKTGYYRVIVFIFTPYPFNQTNAKLKREDAQEWLSAGSHVLPKSIRQKTYSQEYDCIALIYEFTKGEGEEPKLELPGHLSGRDHLEKAKILLTLKQSP